MAGKANRRGFGYVRRLPSKRYQASYIGPDTQRHAAPSTFDTKGDAEAWLSDEYRRIAAETWTPPKLRRQIAESNRPATLETYATAWLKGRDLKPRTRAHYAALLRDHIIPTFGAVPVEGVSAESVRLWHAALDRKHPTTKAHAYGLLRAILATAVSDGILPTNPCHIRGAGNSKRVKKIRPATLEELEVLVAAMPERLHPMTLLAAWCGLRFGELVELRRRDIDLKAGVIHIRRAAVRVDGGVVIGTPKSDAGIRDVAIPPHLLPMLKEHMGGNIAGGKDGLLFPGANGGTLAPSALYGRAPKGDKSGSGFYCARAAAGRPDLRWHDLRHTGAVLAAQTGATLAELMGRLGHSTPQAALRYQHAAQGRDAQIAAALSTMAEANSIK